MNTLKVVLAQALPAYHPGEALEGTAEWELSMPTKQLELRLCWTTDAPAGSEEPVVLKTETIEAPSPEGRRRFRWELPEGPWSFEGKLFSVKWFLELVDEADERGRTEFVLSPTGQPLRNGPPTA